MDPLACFLQMAEAIAEDDWETAGERAEDLLHWLDKGGFSSRHHRREGVRQDRGTECLPGDHDLGDCVARTLPLIRQGLFV